MERYERALVLGLGASGEWAARLLARDGTAVTVVDSRSDDALQARRRDLGRLGVRVLLGTERCPVEAFDVCVISPGIRSDAPLARGASEQAPCLLAELELGWSRRRTPVLAITGSNGKSSLAKLCAETLAGAGLRASVCGNFGPPVSRAVLEEPQADWLVVEVSSFQLEHVRRFSPDVGVLLNILPNHLDRHGDMATYAGTKARLFARMGPGCTAIVNETVLDTLPDAVRRRLRAKGNGADGPACVTFGCAAGADYRYVDGTVRAAGCGAGAGEAASVCLAGTYFGNEVFGLAGAAAVAAMDACGVARSAVAEAARRFHPLPHRMCRIATRRRVRVIDDSKATNMAALRAALAMCEPPVRLIAGGLAKETEFGAPKKELAKKVRGAYLIGEAAPVLRESWQDVVACRLCLNLEEAVRRAWQDAEEGDAVLLAPGCASFDQFRSFEERGEQFVRIVRSLDGEERL
ncbi:MAG: UDP-N-acetylmuramoyl-L-alanine--D-glutamate ligase [Kiritimatiellae bacterium]|nr:UDP-N-acetylmuramoyl-L-alanine--D-glutamate ligase [Kiritimatiellia bacterium]